MSSRKMARSSSSSRDSKRREFAERHMMTSRKRVGSSSSRDSKRREIAERLMMTSRKRARSSSSRDSKRRENAERPLVYKKCSDRKDSDMESLAKAKKAKMKCYSRSTLEQESDMQYYYFKSGYYIKYTMWDKAMKYIKMARRLCKENDIFLAKIYARRGTIFSEREKPKCSLQGCVDWEHAYAIDENNLEARENLAKVLFMAANNFYRMKKYKKALLPAETAYKMISDNRQAYMLIKLIKKKLFDKEIDSRDFKVQKIYKKKSKRASISVTKPIPEKASYEKSRHEKSSLDEIECLNKLAESALLANNYTLAFQCVNRALQQYEDEIPDDTLFRRLFVLKNEIMKASPALMKSA